MLDAGTRLGPYEILAALGAGGMGEVYRARDPRLGREVAIKVLPSELSSDPDRLNRFEQEARSASALNHPNIVTIYDIGRADGVSYIAMELVEGKTLGELLLPGALATKQILRIAVQVAEGLSRAHSVGIVHRDLKPENLMVSRDGLVKILDFGLAKLTVPESGLLSSLPTVAGEQTRPGSVLGTVGYMSPEQASGQPVDFRSDQFSLGSILYEMATGRKAFQRGTAIDTLSAILHDEPNPISSINPQAPAPLRWIVERCLAKDPEERYASTRDLARELQTVRDHISEAGVSGETGVAVPRPRRLRAAALALLAVALVAALSGVFLLGKRADRTPPPSFRRLTFSRGYVRGARFTPDGQSIVYAAAWEGGPLKLYLKHPESPDALPLELPSANILGISPAGELAIALDCKVSNNGVCQGTLARVPLTGGSPREIAEDVQQVDWAKDGDLAIVRELPQASRLEFPPGKVLYQATNAYISFPRVSPDGKLIAFFDHPIWRDDGGSVAVVDLAGKKRILSEGWASLRGLAWSPSGDEIWFTGAKVASRALYGVRLSGRLRALHHSPGSLTLFDVSRDGRALLAREEERNGVLGAGPGEATERELSWLDFSNVTDISEDGKLLLLTESSEAVAPNGALLLRKMDGSPPIRLGEGGGRLSPDGKRVFTRVPQADGPLLRILPVGLGEARSVKVEGLEWLSGSWFLDSRRVLLYGRQPGRQFHVFLVDPDTGTRRPITPEGIPTTTYGATPDGRYAWADRPDGTWALYPIEAGEPVPMTGILPGELPLRFSGDGRSFFVARLTQAPVRVFHIDLASGARTHWKDFEPADKAGLSYVRFVRLSADASAYAYQYRRWLSVLYTVEGLK